MFLITGNLNEGGCRDKCSEGKKREFFEGKNPRSLNPGGQSLKNSTHVNSSWQKLRK
jgi:hypothetical protein